jgi:hypothetical protein
MFLLLGRRYPWITAVAGAVSLVIGILAGSPVFMIVGCLGLVVGGYRSFASWRRGNGLLGPGQSGRSGTGGMLR